ncbi:hypothetical protein [Thalassomonas actiniarum]|uniref:Uncharacterized protein n=1 Tax=Thalassomonas actiniarum TaxID=485447 RepID=A0AAF0C4T5_9GAMM|nr:hypothetical protein [Thalassomonas actiniarum]WDE00823.1 hypothetical protein SG35_009420 [Thalassomonas actiniarum]
MDSTKEVVIQTVQLSTISDVLAIILSIVALMITFIGFFASLKFYREGVQLQNAANDALVKLQEKTQNIQDQVVGMFDKTLDAAISKTDEIDSSFDSLDKRLKETKESIVQDALSELKSAGTLTEENIERIVSEQLTSLENKISSTRELAENLVSERKPISMSNPSSAILHILKESDKPLQLMQISQRLGITRYRAKHYMKDLINTKVVSTEVVNEITFYSLVTHARPAA